MYIQQLRFTRADVSSLGIDGTIEAINAAANPEMQIQYQAILERHLDENLYVSHTIQNNTYIVTRHWNSQEECESFFAALGTVGQRLRQSIEGTGFKLEQFFTTV